MYGGEWEWDNYNCILHRARGQNSGYVIRYGKNLTDLKQEQSIESTYTGVYPYWKSEDVMVTLPEKVLHAATAANFPFQRTLVKDFSDKFDNAPTEAALRAFTQAFITANGIGIPNVNLSVDFINLADTEEYRELLTTENLDLCDMVTVRFAKLGVEVQAKVIDIRWDVLRERYEKIEIGDRRSTLSSTIEDQLETIATLATAEQVGRSIDRATGVLNSGRRGHVIINRNEEGWANEILFLDNENLASAVNVLRINMAGIGFSSSGYGGPYHQSWDLKGHLSLGGVNNSYGDFMVLDENAKPVVQIDKNGLKLWDVTAIGYYLNGAMYSDADHTAVITPSSEKCYYDLTEGKFYYYTNGAYVEASGEQGLVARMDAAGFDAFKGLIKGATVIAGGSADGQFLIQDAAGNTIGTWDKNGIVINKGTINISRGNDVGLYCDGTVFQFGDFEVNTDYGRQILESTDEKTGFGGEPDEEGGLYLWAGYHGDNDYRFLVNEAGAYTMYNGTPYNIGQTLNYILTECCGGGCSNDGCDCDSYEGCDDSDCPGYGGTGCVPEGAECPADASCPTDTSCPTDGDVCPEDDGPVCNTE